jgi:hypothetical protein
LATELKTIPQPDGLIKSGTLLILKKVNMHFVGYKMNSELLRKALNNYFDNLVYCADCYNVKVEGVQPITFKAIDSQCRVIKTLTVNCHIAIEEEFNDYTYEIDRWAVISLGNLENFLNTFGELLK